ncbi:MAG: dethiobiotin synthase [Candidatus Eremiobacteraeota bacterium]|nr:dethiobiotin synthase [Candidatus Eremiobacteraeota bacterium]
MRRYLVTGTDTDVGKTRVSAALALALRTCGHSPAVVKLVQTGVRPGEPGDAARAGALAGCAFRELARFSKAADPWSAALADGEPALRAADLQHMLAGIPGALVVEGAGGLAVPINASQSIATVAQLAGLSVVVAVGLRLGCINHALLTMALCEQLGISVAGGVLVDRWERSEETYVGDVIRALQGKLKILGIVPFEPDERASVEAAAALFAPLQ